jgi:hypothetical protein
MISKMFKNLTSISPYNKVIHKGPHKLGVRTASFAKTGDQMTKARKKISTQRKKWVVKLLFLHSKIDPKRNLVPNFHCPQSKAKQST